MLLTNGPILLGKGLPTRAYDHKFIKYKGKLNQDEIFPSVKNQIFAKVIKG